MRDWAGGWFFQEWARPRDWAGVCPCRERAKRRDRTGGLETWTAGCGACNSLPGHVFAWHANSQKQPISVLLLRHAGQPCALLQQFVQGQNHQGAERVPEVLAVLLALPQTWPVHQQLVVAHKQLLQQDLEPWHRAGVESWLPLSTLWHSVQRGDRRACEVEGKGLERHLGCRNSKVQKVLLPTILCTVAHGNFGVAALSSSLSEVEL